MSLDLQLRGRVETWIAEDPDPETRAELQRLLDAGAQDELAERFAGGLEFGTAGLRGVLGGGPARMNRAVVRRTSAGLAHYLLATVARAAQRGVVLGYDGRRMSRAFAEEAASAFAGAGLTVHLFDTLCPTPLVAFGVLELGAAAGVMVTASHNPPEYNGYKVYWENGAQIIPPHDAGISAAIDRVGPLPALPSPALADAERGGGVRLVGPELRARYLEALRAIPLHPEAPRDIRIVYTPLHGVGGELANAALAQAGFTRVDTVAAQAEPDGAFPTVRFPNPEEKGALDLALALADERRADLIIANDPDADRLAVAVRHRGAMQALSGDQIGWLLGNYLLAEGRGGSERLAVTTLVSSSLLSRIAAGFGARYAETLTGFKWIANRALELEASGARFVYGYEEALGYCIGRRVRDKDGISAAVLIADLAAFCHRRGETLVDHLEAIFRRYGLCQSAQRSITLPGATGAAQIRAMMDRLRSSPPTAIGGLAVTGVRDLAAGVRRAGGAVEPTGLPKSNVLVFELEGAARIIARPSGTEPKIKFYFELFEAVGEGEAIDAARGRAQRRMDALASAFLAVVGRDA